MRAGRTLRALGGLVSRVLRFALAAVVDAMPSPPDQSDAGAEPTIDDEESRRRARWKMKMLEKRGKGGFR